MSDNKIIYLDERREERTKLYPIFKLLGFFKEKEKREFAKELREAKGEMERAAVINKKRRERK